MYGKSVTQIGNLSIQAFPGSRCIANLKVQQTATTIAMTQEQLRDHWFSSKAGCLSPWQQALALGLREASKELHEEPNLPWICARLTKTGGGHPHRVSRWQFFSKVDADEDWFPGKYVWLRRGEARRAEPSRAEPSRAEPSRAEPSRAEPSRT